MKHCPLPKIDHFKKWWLCPECEQLWRYDGKWYRIFKSEYTMEDHEWVEVLRIFLKQGKEQ